MHRSLRENLTSDPDPFRSTSSTGFLPRIHAVAVDPLLAGVIAIALAALFLGGPGLIAAILGVGSWWIYKLWPRRTSADDLHAQAYLSRLDFPTLDAAAQNSEADREANSGPDALGEIRL
jgi:hypothetical protein